MSLVSLCHCPQASYLPAFLKMRKCCIMMITSSSRKSSEKEGSGCKSPNTSLVKLQLPAEVFYKAAGWSFWILPFSFPAISSDGEFGMLQRFSTLPVCPLRSRVHGVRPRHPAVPQALSKGIQRVLQTHGDVWGLVARGYGVYQVSKPALFLSGSQSNISDLKTSQIILKQTVLTCSITSALIFPSVCVTARFLGRKLNSCFYHLPRRWIENLCRQLL